MADRCVLRISGSEARDFLQNLVTNDVAKLEDGLVWAALLTPQGKYLADFFLVPKGDAILLDVAAPLAAGLQQRLTMYKLRADVAIEATDVAVSRGVGAAPEGAFADPRHPSLGWRAYDGRDGEDVDWDALRVAAGVRLPTVEFPGGEEIFVMSGSFEDEHGRYGKYSWVRYPAGGEHAPHTAEGCTLYVKKGHLG